MGFHYEISNFAKNGYDSKHNLNYWNNNQYYGFGCGAHGYENGMRYANCFDIHKYMENPLTKDFGHFETQKEKTTSHYGMLSFFNLISTLAYELHF